MPPSEYSYPVSFDIDPLSTTFSPHIINSTNTYSSTPMKLSSFLILSKSPSNPNQLIYRTSPPVAYSPLPSILEPQLLDDFSAILSKSQTFPLPSSNLFETPILNYLETQITDASVKALLNYDKKMVLPPFLYPNSFYDVALDITTLHNTLVPPQVHTKPFVIEIEFFNINLQQHQLTSVLSASHHAHLDQIRRKLEEVRILLSYNTLLGQTNLDKTTMLRELLDYLTNLYDATSAAYTANPLNGPTSPSPYLDPSVLTLVAKTKKTIKPYTHFDNPFQKPQQYVPNSPAFHQAHYPSISYTQHPLSWILSFLYDIIAYFLSFLNIFAYRPICFILETVDKVTAVLYELTYIVLRWFNLHGLMVSQTTTSTLLVQDFQDLATSPTHAIKITITALPNSTTHTEYSDLQFISSAALNFYHVPTSGLMWFLYYYYTAAAILGTVIFTLMYLSLFFGAVITPTSVLLYILWTLNNTNEYIPHTPLLQQ